MKALLLILVVMSSSSLLAKDNSSLLSCYFKVKQPYGTFYEERVEQLLKSNDSINLQILGRKQLSRSKDRDEPAPTVYTLKLEELVDQASVKKPQQLQALSKSKLRQIQQLLSDQKVSSGGCKVTRLH